MKFGKKLVSVSNSSDPEWAPFWPNYKLLKKRIKDILTEPGFRPPSGTASSSSSSSSSSSATAGGIQSSAAEVAFFKAVHAELRKSSEFFTSTVEQQYVGRRNRVREGLRQLQAPYEEHLLPEDAATFLLAACLDVYKELIMLENFAIMTHTAFSKILKKHDKRTGFTTREAFMKKVVASASFARYPALKQMLTELEQMYREILALQPPARGGDTSGGSGGAASAPDLGSRAEIREPEALDGLEPTVEAGGARSRSGASKAGQTEMDIEIAKNLSADSLRELREELTTRNNKAENDDSDDESSPANLPGGPVVAEDSEPPVKKRREG